MIMTESVMLAGAQAARARHGTASPGAAADLLTERRLLAPVLLSAARVTTDDERDAIARVIQRAREFAAFVADAKL